MNPSTVFDIALVVFAALIIIKFTIEGFFSSILDLCKGFLAIVTAYLMRIAIGRLFYSLFMKDAMVSLVYKSLELSLNENIDKLGIDIKSLQENTPEFFEKLLTKFGLDHSKYLEDFDAFFVNDNQEVMGSLAENVGGAIAMLLATALALLAGLIASYIIFSIVVHFLLKLTKFEGVKSANRWLGLALGCVIAFFVLWGCSMGAELLVQFVGPALPEYINEDLTNGSMVVGIFKHISPIEFIKKLIYS